MPASTRLQLILSQGLVPVVFKSTCLSSKSLIKITFGFVYRHSVDISVSLLSEEATYTPFIPCPSAKIHGRGQAFVVPAIPLIKTNSGANPCRHSITCRHLQSLIILAGCRHTKHTNACINKITKKHNTYMQIFRENSRMHEKRTIMHKHAWIDRVNGSSHV